MMSDKTEFYSNPKHLVDLNLSQLEIIRNEFEKYEVEAKNQNKYNDGIPLEVFSIYLYYYRNSLFLSFKLSFSAFCVAVVQS